MSEWPYNYEGCYCGVKSRRVVFPVPGGGNSSAPADLWHRFSGTESIPGALDAREQGLVAAELQALTNQRKEDGMNLLTGWIIFAGVCMWTVFMWACGQIALRFDDWRERRR